MAHFNFRSFFNQQLDQNPDRLCLIFLLVISFTTRFLFLGHPESAVFDEVHFNYFAHFYYTGQYFYDIHPPLGKLLIALSTYPFGGIAPDEVIRTISTPYPSETYMIMRAVPAFFGACLPSLIFIVGRQLNLSIKAAFLAGFIIALDNALLIQSRLILLDPMLLFFGFAGLAAFLKTRRELKISWMILASVLAGCSISVKWIGVSFLGLIGLIILVDWINTLLKKRFTLRPFFAGTSLVIISLTTYMMIFAIHFSLLPISHKQGDQFMSIAFQSTLEGSRYYEATGTVKSLKCPQGYKHSLHIGMPNTQVSAAQALACRVQYNNIEAPGFFAKLGEITRVMYTTNQGLSQTHPDASPWYSWPIMGKPLYYWHHEGARIYLLGNPAAWWLGIGATLIMMAGIFLSSRWRQNEAFWIVMTGFWANLLPFTLVARVMFMYHYLTSLCFSVLVIGFFLDRFAKIRWLFPTVLVFCICCFLLLSPITYGVNWYGSDLLWLLRFFRWHP